MGRSVVMLFDVKGEPKGDPRARSNQNRPGVYKPDTADKWKDDVRAAVTAEIMADPPEELWPIPAPAAFAVAVVFRFARPKAHLRTGKHAGKLKAWAPYWHTSKPDIDNLLKSTLDAIGSYPRGMPPLVWCDDAQVVVLLDPLKRFVHEGEEPGATIGIFQLQGAR